jgi:ureidoglycolate hydrolase
VRVVADHGERWVDAYSKAPVLDRAAHIGRTVGPPATEPVTAMERHRTTREVLVSLDGPLVLPLCSGAHERPVADEVVAVLLAAGQVISLHPGTWHAPAMGLDGPSTYLWLAAVDDHAASSWTAVDGGPVVVDTSAASGPTVGSPLRAGRD